MLSEVQRSDGWGVVGMGSGGTHTQLRQLNLDPATLKEKCIKNHVHAVYRNTTQVHVHTHTYAGNLLVSQEPTSLMTPTREN